MMSLTTADVFPPLLIETNTMLVHFIQKWLSQISSPTGKILANLSEYNTVQLNSENWLKSRCIGQISIKIA
jgi:putative component of membrane protein insertase Oxa1/YidC/SpoIIIJ protein YidD